MQPDFPVSFSLKDKTMVIINRLNNDTYEFHLTRLNSEKHNFTWDASNDVIEESYETRFDSWQKEAVARFREILVRH